MTARDTILVFLKNPQPGEVKTRLAATIGAERAAALYRQWIGLVLDKLQPLRDRADLLGYFDGGPVECFHEWHHLTDLWLPQPKGGLGERLDLGFAAAHQSGGSVLAVGTDCLELDGHLVTQAFAVLQDHDAVFGPAEDGGYYLVGTSSYLPGFFTGIRWSSEHTLQDHLGRCLESGWSVSMLPARPDIDIWDDWQAYLRRSNA